MIIACTHAFNEEKYIASVVLKTKRYVEKSDSRTLDVTCLSNIL